MNIAELNQRIANVNAQTKALNTQRLQNMGKVEALQSQLTASMAEYEKKYGKKITPETLNAEIETVMKAKEAELTQIESMLVAIENGEYENAQKITGVEPKAEETAEAPTEVVETPTQAVATPPKRVEEPLPNITAPTPKAQPTPEVVTPSQTQAVAQPPKAKVNEEEVAPPPVAAPPKKAKATAQTVAQPAKTAETESVVKPPKKALNLSGIEALNGFAPATETPAETPKAEDKQVVDESQNESGAMPDITSFSAILGNSLFNG